MIPVLACLALLSQDAPRAVGAEVPFVTLEAEDGQTNGRVARLTGLPGPDDETPELEASGRGFVELAATGEGVEFTVPFAAQGLVLRHCIPDAPEGGGMAASLGLFVNGVRRQDLTLSSRYNWLYGTGKRGENGQSNAPTAFPHVFWDETAYVVAGGLQAGDRLALRREAQDTAAFYRLDLVDLEPIPAPLSPPADALSVTEFGATGGDAEADTAALEQCVEAARAQGKSVWLPPGTWLNQRRVTLDGVSVRGAGMWHTKLLITSPAVRGPFGGHGGFRLSGTGPQVRDLTIEAVDCTQRGNTPTAFIGQATNFVVEDVWMVHLHVGFWIAGDGGVIRRCRVRQTYADGININNGKTVMARNIVVEHCHIRGTGDDGLAILSSEVSPNISENIQLRRNTVVASWWGHNCDLAGGFGHLIEDNLFADGTKAAFTVNLPSAYPMHPLTSAVVRGNLMLRAGSNYVGQRRGAIWIFPGSTSIDGLVIEDNEILQPIFRGIHLVGTQPQHITFRRNRIVAPGQDAIVIERQVRGGGEWVGNEVADLPPGGRAFVNDAAEYDDVQRENVGWAAVE